jgi:exosome complex exonuclease DIS3/RRP44
MLDGLQVIDFSFFFPPTSKEQSQKSGDVIFRIFDPVTVQLSLDQSNLQHEKIVLKLVYPQVSLIEFVFRCVWMPVESLLNSLSPSVHM